MFYLILPLHEVTDSFSSCAEITILSHKKSEENSGQERDKKLIPLTYTEFAQINKEYKRNHSRIMDSRTIGKNYDIEKQIIDKH